MTGSTHLTMAEVRQIVHLSGTHIRLFLGNGNLDDFTGDAKEAIAAFHQDPGDFSDERMLEKGANAQEAHQYTVRIELRAAGPDGAAQIAAKGIWGVARDKAVIAMSKELGQRYSPHEDQGHCPVIVRTAGSASFEFNRRGVDKGLPIRYAQTCWENILDQMSYAPGALINSRLNHTVIAADGDGTIYDGPSKAHLPALKDGPVHQPLLAYLRCGGVFMLISGNDLRRACKRLIQKIPPELRVRLLVSANGGADLVYMTADGKPHDVEGYRHKALGTNGPQAKPLDIVYIGDDPSPAGNDHAAFLVVGPQRSVLVKNPADTRAFIERWLYERKIPSS